jgi:hypothetical protein
MRALAVSLAFVLLGAALIVRDVVDRAAATCAERWDDATMVDVSPRHLVGDEIGRVSPYRTVRVADRAYVVVPYINKSTGWGNAPQNPLSRQSVYVTVGVTADDRASLDRLTPLCVRAIYHGDVWQPRATSWDLQILGNGKTHGSTGAGSGPSWPGQVTAHVELLLDTPDGRVIFDAGDLVIGLSD